MSFKGRKVTIIFFEDMQQFNDDYIIYDTEGHISDKNFTLVCKRVNTNEVYYFRYNDIIYMKSDDDTFTKENISYTDDVTMSYTICQNENNSSFIFNSNENKKDK